MKKLAVPHFQQQHPYTCIPACARMVLAYWGHTHSEEELAQAFDTVPFLGTLPEKATHLRQDTGTVQVEELKF